MTKRELKPCPFCGGEAKFENFGYQVYIKCTKCKATSATFLSRVDYCAVDEVAKAWNRRVKE